MKRAAILLLLTCVPLANADAAKVDINTASERSLSNLVARRAYRDKGKKVNTAYCQKAARSIIAKRPYGAIGELTRRKVISRALYSKIAKDLVANRKAGAPPTSSGGDDALPFPKRVDHTSRQSPVRDQGDRNTCVAFSTTAGLERFRKSLDLSEQLLYYLLRENGGEKTACTRLKYDPKKPNLCDDKCAGATIENAVSVLRRIGLYTESTWRYRPADNKTPGVSCHEFSTWAATSVSPKGKSVVKLGKVVWLAQPKGTPASKRVNDPMVLMAILAAGYDVNVLLDVAGSGWDAGKNIDVELDPRTRRPLKSEGGHGVLLVGYDYDRGAFKFKNSWAGDWAEGGYGWLTFDYVRTYVWGGYYATGIVRARGR